MSRHSFSWVLGASLLLHACVDGGELSEHVGAGELDLAHPGPWVIPADTLATGDEHYVLYTGAGAWNDGKDCSGGLEPGAAIVRSYLLAHFPQIKSIGGYNCRQNTANLSQMSIHAVGRALDIMLPTVGTAKDADNDLGDPVGNWLIENAETIGIQYIIWDEWTWMAARSPGTKGRLYTGPNPHHDHLHVELSAEAGDRTTDWFSGLVDPPVDEGCLPLSVDGGVIDALDACFDAYGPAAYWRTESGVGHGGSLTWTNAWTNPTPSNWGRWNVAFEEGGEYVVEVYLTAPYAVYGATRYTVRHDGLEETVYVDQAGATAQGSGWVTLGTFAFATGGDQWVAVYDNVAGSVATNQRIVVDALRVLPVTQVPEPGPITEPEAMGPNGPDPDVDPGEAVGPGDVTTKAGGCAAAGDAPVDLAWALGLTLVFGARRLRLRPR